MAVLRLSNGDDLVVKLSAADSVARLKGDGFVDFESEEGPVRVRPSGVIAVIDSSERKSTGFRIGMGPDSEKG